MQKWKNPWRGRRDADVLFEILNFIARKLLEILLNFMFIRTFLVEFIRRGLKLEIEFQSIKLQLRTVLICALISLHALHWWCTMLCNSVYHCTPMLLDCFCHPLHSIWVDGRLAHVFNWAKNTIGDCFKLLIYSRLDRHVEIIFTNDMQEIIKIKNIFPAPLFSFVFFFC